MPFALKASFKFSCDIIAPSKGATPLVETACGLSGLVAGEFTKLVFRECWMLPCTMEAWR